MAKVYRGLCSICVALPFVLPLKLTIFAPQQKKQKKMAQQTQHVVDFDEDVSEQRFAVAPPPPFQSAGQPQTATAFPIFGKYKFLGLRMISNDFRGLPRIFWDLLGFGMNS